jgi:hypothetical protein
MTDLEKISKKYLGSDFFYYLCIAKALKVGAWAWAINPP